MTTEIQLANLLKLVPKSIANDLDELIDSKARELSVNELIKAEHTKSWHYVRDRIDKLNQ